MSKVTFQMSISLDGFAAGPGQSLEKPLGIGGEALHTWAVQLEEWRNSHHLEGGTTNVSSEVLRDSTADIGAYVMGRNMFGGGPGPWKDDSWQGWWGKEPPFHTPVYVLTHFPRETLRMDGGTSFHFVTEGADSALQQARSAAGAKNVAIGGGASTVQQYLRSGEVTEFWVHVVPIILGSGSRLIDDIEEIDLEQVSSVGGKGVTHIKYRVIK